MKGKRLFILFVLGLAARLFAFGIVSETNAPSITWGTSLYFVSYSIQGSSLIINTSTSVDGNDITPHTITMDGSKWIEYLMARLLYAQARGQVNTAVAREIIQIYQPDQIRGVRFCRANTSYNASNMVSLGFYTYNAQSYVEVGSVESGATRTHTFNAISNGYPLDFLVSQLVQIPIQQSLDDGPLSNTFSFEITRNMSGGSCIGYTITNRSGWAASRFSY